MRALSRAALALLLVAAATPALAQDYGASAGWYAAALHATSMNSGAAGTAINPGWGWAGGAYYEKWLGSGRVAYRFDGSVGRQQIPWNGQDRNVNTWLGDFGLELRLLPAAPGRSVSPFLSAGPGVVVYDLGRGLPVTDEAANALYQGRQKALFAPNFGGGFDIITPWTVDFNNIVVRLQADDYVVLKSPFQPISGSDFGLVHQLRFAIGLHAGMGTLGGASAQRVR